MKQCIYCGRFFRSIPAVHAHLQFCGLRKKVAEAIASGERKPTDKSIDWTLAREEIATWKNLVQWKKTIREKKEQLESMNDMARDATPVRGVIMRWFVVKRCGKCLEKSDSLSYKCKCGGEGGTIEYEARNTLGTLK